MFPPEILEVTKLKDFLENLDKKTKLLFGDVNSKNNLRIEDIKNFEIFMHFNWSRGRFFSIRKTVYFIIL